MYICVADPIWRRLLKIFRHLRSLQDTIESRSGNRHEDADGRDYNEQLNQGEGAL